MKITYQFDTDSEGFDRGELLAIENACKLVVIISEIRDQLREWYKYDTRSTISTEEISDTINRIIDKHFNIEELIY